MKKPKSKPEKFAFRYDEKMGLRFGDDYTIRRMKERGYHHEDLLFASISKPRKPWYNRWVHKLGTLCVDNIEPFKYLDAHTSIKKIQWEADIECFHMVVLAKDIGPVDTRWPESISFENMEQGRFEEMFKKMCAYVCETYWPDMDPEQIEEMAKVMPD